MIYLLVDNSNTRTKFTLATPEGLLDWRAIIATREVSGEALEEALEGRTFDCAVVSSVVPKVMDILEQWFRVPVHKLSCHSPLGVGIDYPLPEQIGADRLANAAAVGASYPFPCIVVDFGTAVTFDVVDDNGNYAGGVIAPGLAFVSDYLAHNTAQLPTINPREPSQAIGKSTEDAMHAGAIYGYRGLVKEIIARLEAELENRPAVIATGGDARLIASRVDRIDHVDKDITLNGLLVVARNVFGCDKSALKHPL